MDVDQFVMLAQSTRKQAADNIRLSRRTPKRKRLKSESVSDDVADHKRARREFKIPGDAKLVLAVVKTLHTT